MMTPANRPAQSPVYFMEVIMFCRPMESVRILSLPLAKISAMKYSFQMFMKLKIVTVMMPGEAIGIMTFHMAFISEQPSIMAASASAVGTVEKNAVRKYTVYGRFSVVYRITSVDRCPTRFALTNQQ